MSPGKKEENPSGYPRVYRVDRKTRLVVCWGATILCGVLFILTLVKSIHGPEHLRIQMASVILVNVLFDAVVAWSCLRVFKSVILYEDAIEVAGLFSTRRLRRDEVLGWRMNTTSRGGFYYVIVPFNKGTRSLKLPPFLRLDKFFYETIPKVES